MYKVKLKLFFTNALRPLMNFIKANVCLEVGQMRKRFCKRSFTSSYFIYFNQFWLDFNESILFFIGCLFFTFLVPAKN